MKKAFSDFFFASNSIDKIIEFGRNVILLSQFLINQIFVCGGF